MTNMRPPRIPEAPVPVLNETALKRLLVVCQGEQGFAERRDLALFVPSPRGKAGTPVR